MGVQLARGFPPRSKWTYMEVFHPAVVPPPPFIKLFFFLQFIIMGMCVCHSCSNKCFWGLRFQGLIFGSQFLLIFGPSQLRFLGQGIFGSWFFGKSFGSLFIIGSGEWAQAFGLQVFIECLLSELGFLGHRISGPGFFRSWQVFWFLGFFGFRLNGLRFLGLAFFSISLIFELRSLWVMGYLGPGFLGWWDFLGLRFLWVQV